MTVISLPLEKAPVFADVCVGCGKTSPSSRWSYDRETQPFAATAGYYAAQGMLPALAVPVCRVCRHFMPKDMGFWRNLVYPWQLWFVNCFGQRLPNWLLRSASWRLDSPNEMAFNVQVLRDDWVDYHFRSPEAAAAFAKLNAGEPAASAAG